MLLIWIFLIASRQAVEDINSLADVVHFAVYLTKLAVMANPKTSQLVSPVTQ